MSSTAAEHADRGTETAARERSSVPPASNTTQAVDPAEVWSEITAEAQILVTSEPRLASFYHSTILTHDSVCKALSYILANRLSTAEMPAIAIREVIEEAHEQDPELIFAAASDMVATRERDPAVTMLITPLLYLKGYHALQAYRVGHFLCERKRYALAAYMQSQISKVFGVDIHPAAQIGRGVMMDHATGIVIGETAVVGHDVSILQNVTLGGTGIEIGDRHPKIRDGVLIGAGATVLGNIVVGEGAKIGAGSVVLKPVPAHSTVVGVPARVVGRPSCQKPSLRMDQMLHDDNLIDGAGI